MEQVETTTTSFLPVALGLAASFGFGDRTGLATPGHAKALMQAGRGILPIFAQQSIREMTRTQRTPEQVMSAAAAGMKAVGFRGPSGADADHLKTPQDVDRTAAAGFVFFTIDPSAQVDVGADEYPPEVLAAKYREVADQATWVRLYQGKEISLPTAAGSKIKFDETVCMKAAVKYGRAINLTIELARYIESVAKNNGRSFEIELSVDETPQPTTLAEHYIIADQLRSAGVKLISLAPRFIGDFEKGVDYKGDVEAFERSLADHAALARMLGPYKLSLHSGSDKISIYPALASATRGLFHVKTAGTSYLEALRVVARHDAELFRKIIDFSRSRYDTDRATYHVSATNEAVPPPSAIADDKQLEATYLGSWEKTEKGRGLSDPGRQILHCTFGSVLTHPEWGPAVRFVLEGNPNTYQEVLAMHFSKHLEALRAGM
jgi:tagaturonate epimerase